MSLGLHLTVLDSGCAMPSLNRQSLQINNNNVDLDLELGLDPELSIQKRSQHIHCNGLLATKEYSLINHIESLRALANGDISSPFTKVGLTPNEDKAATDTASSTVTISPSCQHSFPSIASSPHLTRGKVEAMSILARPLSSKWATNPDLVPGNLRTNSDGKQVSLTLEEILSRGSSSVAKLQDSGLGCDNKDETEITKDICKKIRRKSAKSTRKKSVKNKDASQSKTEGLREGRRSIQSTHNAIRDIERKVTFNHTSSNDLNSLTALCKGMKIQEKQSNSISVKQVPYVRKTSTTTTSPSQKTSSPFRSSLENAVIEYSKKAVISNPDHRRKATRAVEENFKTTKVFLSEKQSGVISDCGASVPCAPPATPTADQLRRYEYVPSLQDIRSQRSFRQRLEMMETRALRKEKKKQAESMKQEKMSMREKRMELKKQQRLEIYALNEMMTKLENDRFKHFMLNAGVNM